jgi:hypothetical protein
MFAKPMPPPRPPTLLLIVCTAKTRPSAPPLFVVKRKVKWLLNDD